MNLDFDTEVTSEILDTANKEKKITIGSFNFDLGAIKHRDRLAVFNFMGAMSDKGILAGMIGSKEIEPIIAMIENNTLLDGAQISKIKDFWEQEQAQDIYLEFVATMLQVYVRPFLRGKRTS